jgi:hypothetical protein
LEGAFRIWSPLEGLLLFGEYRQWFCNIAKPERNRL